MRKLLLCLAAFASMAFTATALADDSTPPGWISSAAPGPISSPAPGPISSRMVSPTTLLPMTAHSLSLVPPGCSAQAVAWGETGHELVIHALGVSHCGVMSSVFRKAMVLRLDKPNERISYSFGTCDFSFTATRRGLHDCP